MIASSSFGRLEAGRQADGHPFRPPPLLQSLQAVRFPANVHKIRFRVVIVSEEARFRPVAISGATTAVSRTSAGFDARDALDYPAIH